MMSTAPGAVIRVEELRIRVPGLSRDAAHALGERVAALVARGLADLDDSVDLGALQLRVPVGRTELMPERVADAIVQSISDEAARR